MRTARTFTAGERVNPLAERGVGGNRKDQAAVDANGVDAQELSLPVEQGAAR
jgi:hypothetical protein